ncbi:uncharacterized protein LOC117342669 [Pecten maximus]|uniref:uncharacterized protein LOC117342669 n=1 Tax=Pecten maximus TaxID=6579 RepID=UPI00145853EE|nr:uncharacterized protein LOC117342669 [Pecten maximus]
MSIVLMLLLLTVESLCNWLPGHFYKDDNFLGYQPDVGDLVQTLRARQPASKNVLYSPNRPQTTPSITTVTSTSAATTSGVRNISDCLSFPSDYAVDMWSLNKYLVLIGPTTVSIDEATTTCTCLGGHLVILHGQAKFDYFTDYLDVHIPESYLVIIGLRADHYSGPWLWPDGSYLNNTPAFCPYEPSGDTSFVYVERCTVMMHPGGCMDDRNCPVPISSIYFACDVF